MKKSTNLIFLLSAVLFCGCSPLKHTLSVMTYNVGVFDKYMDDSMDDIAAMVRSLGVDVVALNELDSCNRRHDTYQLKDFAQALGGWDYSYSGSFAFAGGSYGNGIVSRDAISYSEKVLLPVSDGAEQRSMLIVETEKFVMACTHLDHKGQNARMDQVRFIDSLMRQKYENYEIPVFLCGDMNSIPSSPEIKELLKHWTMLSDAYDTWPSDLPVQCIDYIFCLNPGSLSGKVRSYIPNKSKVSRYSDHLPVVVEESLND